MYRIYFVCVIAFLYAYRGTGQDKGGFKENCSNQRAKHASVKRGLRRSYQEQTVVFKIKPQFHTILVEKKQQMPQFAKLFKELGVTAIESSFPGAKAPEKPHNYAGLPLADLSRIYELKYSAKISVEDAAARIMATGAAEYAEPLFIDNLLVIPNDSLANPALPPGDGQGRYLSNMHYYEALDVEDGDTNVVIGIIDTGTRWYHEDLSDNIKYNYADPLNGTDDDNDGYTDNFIGWDLGMGDNDPDSKGNEHGTIVSGIAGAVTNNVHGIAGIGGKSKILPIKGATDDPSSGIYQGYKGIKYAADHGCKVMNLSWGGPGGYSQAGQDAINYAAINHDVVIVAAAGNDATEDVYYPASFDNVLSVAAIEINYNPGLDSNIETPASFATHNYYVDLGAMGRQIASTGNNGYVTHEGGSSFASPIVAGTAALVRAKYPALNALQVAELVRITADPLIDTAAGNLWYKQEMMGKGRVNAYRALTETTSPAVRMYKKSVNSKFGAYAFSGDTAKIMCNFINYLQPTANLTVTLSSPSPYVTIVRNTFAAGSIQTLEKDSNTTVPFLVFVNTDAPEDTSIFFRLGYSDPAKNYQDYQYFELQINPKNLDIDTNKVTLTITNNGRFGFSDAASSVGDGMMYQGQNLLFEGGLMVGISPSNVSDCVRNANASTGGVDFDFKYIQLPKYASFPEGDQGVKTILTDTANKAGIGLIIEQRSYAYHNAPDDKYIITEYLIQNVSGKKMDSLNVGIFSDFDIQDAYHNKAAWDGQDSLGFTYAIAGGGLYAGVSLLTNNRPQCYSMDNSSVGGNNINPNDGFTTAEKYTTLTKGIGRAKAGGTAGNDVSQVVGGTLYNIANNEKRTIAFAHVAGDDLFDLITNSQRARRLFRIHNTSSLPEVTDKNICKNDTADVTITPGNGSVFNFYTSPSAPSPVFTGSSYTLHNVFNNDTVYVKGADSLFESPAAMVKIIKRTDLKADFTYMPSPIDLSKSNTAYFVSTSQNSNNVAWSISDGTTNNTSSFMHPFYTSGTYTATLYATDAYGCMDSITKQVDVIGETLSVSGPSDMQDGVFIRPNPSSGNTNIGFELPTAKNIHVAIYNSIGEEIITFSGSGIQSTQYAVALSEKGKGVYFAKIEIEGKVMTRKIIIE